MSEVGPTAVKEVIDQEPFVIRAHHLRSYVLLLKQTFLSPAERAKEDREVLEELRLPNTKQGISDEWMSYAQDVIGSSSSDAKTYENNTKAVFEKFLSLPEDYPVDIAEGIPDAICNTCIIGEHCRRLRYSEKNQKNTIEIDAKYLDAFLKTLQDLHLPNPSIISDRVHFFDAKSQEVRKIKTSMGIVRKALKESSLIFWIGLSAPIKREE
ncbi:MAG: hypothetical protein HY425_03185 [Candidatus Levybacteria bacterium]|nr:hypothetical protein [Candidatus Levybacteria bacterium]